MERDDASPARLDLTDEEIASHILAVHVGHASNCSSVGSVVDFLFVSAAAGAALLAAVAATLAARAEPVEDEADDVGEAEDSAG